jgi:hypothetical protein
MKTPLPRWIVAVMFVVFIGQLAAYGNVVGAMIMAGLAMVWGFLMGMFQVLDDDD